MPWGGSSGSISETNPNPEFETSKTGDVVGGNYTEVEADGTTKFSGDATVWDDLTGSLIARRLESTQGTLNYDYDENIITMQPGGGIDDRNDRLIFNFQYPHACIVDGEMHLHIHWIQNSLDKIEFTTQYRSQNNGLVKNDTWTTVTANSDDDSVFTYVSGELAQITELAVVDMTDAGISATVQFRLARTDVTTQDIEAVFVDAHVKRDTIGSRTEYVK